MGETKIITVDQGPSGANDTPTVNLNKSAFDVLIEKKGVDVWHDHAIKCPCSSKSGTSNQSNCQNCGGAGWLYVNRVETRMVVQSMNAETKLKEWSEERLGTAKITARAETRLTFMDKVTLVYSESEHSQVVFLKEDPNASGVMYGGLMYEPIDIYSVFVFVGVDVPLRLLGKDEYELKGSYIVINLPEVSADASVSVRYKHRAEYTVLDLPRDVMISTEKNKCDNRENDNQFPISAVARRSHYQNEKRGYEIEEYFDNSFEIE